VDLAGGQDDLQRIAQGVDQNVDFCAQAAFARKRRKSPGTPAFFSCADSPPWTLYVMCRRHPPFPR
jgi:hypothetical protein